MCFASTQSLYTIPSLTLHSTWLFSFFNHHPPCQMTWLHSVWDGGYNALSLLIPSVEGATPRTTGLSDRPLSTRTNVSEINQKGYVCVFILGRKGSKQSLCPYMWWKGRCAWFSPGRRRAWWNSVFLRVARWTPAVFEPGTVDIIYLHTSFNIVGKYLLLCQCIMPEMYVVIIYIHMPTLCPGFPWRGVAWRARWVHDAHIVPSTTRSSIPSRLPYGPPPRVHRQCPVVSSIIQVRPLPRVQGNQWWHNYSSFS